MLLSFTVKSVHLILFREKSLDCILCINCFVVYMSLLSFSLSYLSDVLFQKYIDALMKGMSVTGKHEVSGLFLTGHFEHLLYALIVLRMQCFCLSDNLE